MNTGQRLGGFVLLPAGDERAKIFFQAPQPRGDAAVMQVFAGVAAHPAFG